MPDCPWPGPMASSPEGQPAWRSGESTARTEGRDAGRGQNSVASACPAAPALPAATTSHRLLPLEGPLATGSYLSSADPWLWLLVRREKTLRSLRGRVGGDEGGVNPTSGGLASGDRERHPSATTPDVAPGAAPNGLCSRVGPGGEFASPSKRVCIPK